MHRKWSGSGSKWRHKSLSVVLSDDLILVVGRISSNWWKCCAICAINESLVHLEPKCQFCCTTPAASELQQRKKKKKKKECSYWLTFIFREVGGKENGIVCISQCLYSPYCLSHARSEHSRRLQHIQPRTHILKVQVTGHLLLLIVLADERTFIGRWRMPQCCTSDAVWLVPLLVASAVLQVEVKWRFCVNHAGRLKRWLVDCRHHINFQTMSVMCARKLRKILGWWSIRYDRTRVLSWWDHLIITSGTCLCALVYTVLLHLRCSRTLSPPFTIVQAFSLTALNRSARSSGWHVEVPGLVQ